jgi:hypothetical protein
VPKRKRDKAQHDGEDKMRPCEINGGAATDVKKQQSF